MSPGALAATVSVLIAATLTLTPAATVAVCPIPTGGSVVIATEGFPVSVPGTVDGEVEAPGPGELPEGGTVVTVPADGAADPAGTEPEAEPEAGPGTAPEDPPEHPVSAVPTATATATATATLAATPEAATRATVGAAAVPPALRHEATRAGACPGCGTGGRVGRMLTSSSHGRDRPWLPPEPAPL